MRDYEKIAPRARDDIRARTVEMEQDLAEEARALWDYDKWSDDTAEDALWRENEEAVLYAERLKAAETALAYEEWWDDFDMTTSLKDAPTSAAERAENGRDEGWGGSDGWRNTP